MMLKHLRENMEFKAGVWAEDAEDTETGERYRITYRRRVYQEPPWMDLEYVEIIKL